MVKNYDATTTDRLRRSPLDVDLPPSCARKRACMELTTICRFQRLPAIPHHIRLVCYTVDFVEDSEDFFGELGNLHYF